MSEYPQNPPEAAASNQEQSDKQQEETTQDQASKRLREFQGRLSPGYSVYSDSQQEKGEKTLFNNKEFLEFIGALNPDYTKFLNQLVEQNLQEAKSKDKKGLEEFDSIYAEYEKKLEFLRVNYSLPLTDSEAVQALAFLNKEQNPTIEIAQKKVEAWRNLAVEWGYTLEGKNKKENKPDNPPIISLARAGFTLKETAPAIRDQQKAKQDKGLCYKDFKYLQDWNFPNPPTTDEIRFFIPRLVPSSLNHDFAEQTALITQITQTLERECKEWKTPLTIGETNQIANEILSHYNNMAERIPLNIEYARTLTRDAGGFRLCLGDFGAGGLRCGLWGFDEVRHGDLGVFVLGAEKALGH